MNKLTLSVVILLLVIVGGFAMFYFYGTSVYDGAVKRQEVVNESWGNVQAAYQRRADLIPNLVATVQGAAENEKQILVDVTNARSGISKATTPGELEQQGNILNRSIAVIFERYPEIRATENFGMLQSQLEGTENRINTERTRYNESVKDFNTYVRGFWKSKALGLVSSGDDNFAKREMFEAKPGSEDAPKVDFSKEKQ
ncbi:MAG: LemA family protein [Flavobacteriales bacterium]